MGHEQKSAKKFDFYLVSFFFQLTSRPQNALSFRSRFYLLCKINHWKVSKTAVFCNTLTHGFMEEQYLGLAELNYFCYIFVCLVNESSVYKYVKMKKNETS